MPHNAAALLITAAIAETKTKVSNPTTWEAQSVEFLNNWLVHVGDSMDVFMPVHTV